MKHRGRILIVEDDPIFADLVKEWLEQNGFEVCGIASDAGGGVTAARGFRPDLCLVDVHLSGEPDGYDAAGRIIEDLGIPVVVMSSRPQPELVVPFLHKPFAEEELMTTLMRQLP